MCSMRISSQRQELATKQQAPLAQTSRVLAHPGQSCDACCAGCHCCQWMTDSGYLGPWSRCHHHLHPRGPASGCWDCQFQSLRQQSLTGNDVHAGCGAPCSWRVAVHHWKAALHASVVGVSRHAPASALSTASQTACGGTVVSEPVHCAVCLRLDAEHGLGGI